MPVEPRPFPEVRAELLARARGSRNPFQHADPAEIAAVLDQLGSVERDPWARAFGALAAPYEVAATEAQGRGDLEAERAACQRAYEYWRVARYPAPNSPVKRAAYLRSQEWYLRLARFFDPPVLRVQVPFRGRPGEGSFAVADLRIPGAGPAPHPVAVLWGGIDSFKEERRTDAYLGAGFATLAVDMPGVGDAPLAGSPDAERLWDAYFDWIQAHPELDADRVVVAGGSTGGYWATKLAHTHAERIRAALNQGGPAHFAFTPEWIARSQTGEYPFELAETLAAAFGLETYDEWAAYAPSLSLLDLGVLDRRHAPLFIMDGVQDSVFPIQDFYLLLEHGGPKTARLYAKRGHMGGTHELAVALPWLRKQVGLEE